ncbi:hypothetical protein ACH4VT_14595 [Streptomyces lydicus]|uniref:hypothetical protein n=1 Tax=Streptomyces lydicus TaxID=47763 RepID=UPI00379C65A2
MTRSATTLTRPTGGGWSRHRAGRGDRAAVRRRHRDPGDRGPAQSERPLSLQKDGAEGDEERGADEDAAAPPERPLPRLIRRVLGRRRVAAAAARFAALGAPRIVVGELVVWLWAGSTGGGSSPSPRDGWGRKWPTGCLGSVRVAAVASALFLVWRMQRVPR